MLSFVKVASFSLTCMKMPAAFSHERIICPEAKMRCFIPNILSLAKF